MNGSLQKLCRLAFGYRYSLHLGFCLSNPYRFNLNLHFGNAFFYIIIFCYILLKASKGTRLERAGARVFPPKRKRYATAKSECENGVRKIKYICCIFVSQCTMILYGSTVSYYIATDVDFVLHWFVCRVLFSWYPIQNFQQVERHFFMLQTTAYDVPSMGFVHRVNRKFRFSGVLSLMEWIRPYTFPFHLLSGVQRISASASSRLPIRLWSSTMWCSKNLTRSITKHVSRSA